MPTITPSVNTFGDVELLPNGELRLGNATYPESAGFYDYYSPAGVRVFKPPGSYQTVLLLYGQRRRAAKFRGMQRGWEDTSHLIPAAWKTVHVPSRRGRRLVANLVGGGLSTRVLWLPVSAATHRYCRLFQIMDDGRIQVGGANYAQGQGFAPITLSNGWILIRPNLKDLQVRDEHGVRDRYRYQGGRGWTHLVALEAVLHGPQDGEFAPDGSVILSGAGPAFRLAPHSEFTVYRSPDWTLTRAAGDGRVVVRDHARTREVIWLHGAFWEVNGARDRWSWSQIGCPGPDEKKWVMPVMPGITVYANGSVEVLNASYGEGQEIDLCTPAAVIKRDAGAFEPLYVTSQGATIAFVMQADGQWWKGLPLAPEPSRGGLTSRHLMSGFSQVLEGLIESTPGLGEIAWLILYINRQCDGIRRNAGILLGFESFLGGVLAWGALGLYLVLICLALTYGVALAVMRHIAQAVRQSR